MPIVQSKSQSNKKFTISAPNFKETIICNLEGEAKVSQKAAELLLTKYAFKEFVIIGDENPDTIEKVEVPQPIKEDEGEAIKTPEIEEVQPSEIEVEDVSEETVDVSLVEVIENIDSLDELKEIATELAFPKEEWEGYKRKDYFKKYLISKISDEGTEEEETA